MSRADKKDLGLRWLQARRRYINEACSTLFRHGSFTEQDEDTLDSANIRANGPTRDTCRVVAYSGKRMILDYAQVEIYDQEIFTVPRGTLYRFYHDCLGPNIYLDHPPAMIRRHLFASSEMVQDYFWETCCDYIYQRRRSQASAGHLCLVSATIEE